MTEEIRLHLGGADDGPPTLEDLIAMSKALTGRDPTPEEIEEARQLLETMLDKD